MFYPLNYGPSESEPQRSGHDWISGESCLDCKVRVPYILAFPLLTSPLPGVISPPPMSTEEINRSLTPQELDFTHAHIMSRYVTETGKIIPRKMTRLSAKQQRKIQKAIKRARNMLMMK